MLYKILTKTAVSITTSGTAGETQKAADELAVEVQELLDDGWELVGGVAMSTTKLSIISIAQSLKKETK